MKHYRPLPPLPPLPTMATALSASTLSDRLAFCRQARGLSMREVARQAGIAASQVCEYEAGTVRPGLDAFFEVARVLSVDPAALYHGVAAP